MLETRRTGPNRCSSTSSRWQPKSAIGPPPASERSSSHDRGSPGCGSNGSKAVICANTGVPISPESMISFTRITRDRSGDSRRCRAPRRRARHAAIIRSHSATSIAIGFSQSTCLPASAAAMVCSRVEADRRGHIHGVDAGIGDELPPAWDTTRAAPISRANCSTRSARARLTPARVATGAVAERSATRFRTMSPAPMRPQRTGRGPRTGSGFRVLGSAFAAVQGSRVRGSVQAVQGSRVQGSGFGSRFGVRVRGSGSEP